MFASIRAFLEPPIFVDDAEKTRQASFVTRRVGVAAAVLGLFIGVG
jgi:hypothetical protein